MLYKIVYDSEVDLFHFSHGNAFLLYRISELSGLVVLEQLCGNYEKQH